MQSLSLLCDRRELNKNKEKMSFPCTKCDAVFSRKGHRDKHFYRIHENITLTHVCSICDENFVSVKELKKHRFEHVADTSFEVTKAALQNTVITYSKKYIKKMETLQKVIHQDSNDIYNVLQYELNARRSIKAQIVYTAEFLKPNPTPDNPDEIIAYTVFLRSGTFSIFQNSDIRRLMNHANTNTQRKIDDFVERGSGWRLDEILQTDIEIATCTPLNGSCNSPAIKHLRHLKKIKVTDNNKNNVCFFEAIAFHFVRKKNTNLLQEFITENFNITVNTPVAVKQIPKFEEANQHLNIQINVLYAEDEDIYPILVSKKRGGNAINILLYKTLIEDIVVDHYTYIEDVDKLLRRVYKNDSKQLTYEKSVRCLNCLQKFTTVDSLNEHDIFCRKNKPQKVVTPLEGDVLKFKKHVNKFPLPIIGFFDFEAIHKQPEKSCRTCESTSVCKHRSSIEAIQEPITYSLIIIESATNNILYKSTYTGTDCATRLLDVLFDLEADLHKRMQQFPQLKMTKENEENFKESTTCHICEDDIYDDEKVRDHCHATGNYLGAAHNQCNLQRKSIMKIPLFCHNMQGYDSHFILTALQKKHRNHIIEGLPYNTERFRTLTLNSYIILDSYSFAGASLSELIDDIAKNPNHQYRILDQTKLYNPDANEDEEKKELLLRKGVYPYEAITDLNVLTNTTEIPPIESFYSHLTNSTISEDDYEHAKKVFRIFNCKNLLQYTELYCLTDVALLAEVMIQFRYTVQEDFGIDCW